MKLKLIFVSMMILGALAACSKGEETAKTEEEIRQEVKAELIQEMEGDLKEELKEEIKKELITEENVASEAPSEGVSVEQVSSESSGIDLSNIDPYITSNLIFSNFIFEKHSDGYHLEMNVENKNDEFQVAFGWGKAGTATLETSDGRYTAEFPHMEKIDPGQRKIYSFKFTNANGTPKNLVISNVLLVNQQNGKLPTPGSDEEYTIPLQ